MEKINAIQLESPVPGAPEKADSVESSKSLIDILKSFGKVLYTIIEFVTSIAGPFALIKKLLKNPLPMLFNTMRRWFVRLLAVIGIAITKRIAMFTKSFGGIKRIGKVGLVGLAGAAIGYGIYELFKRKTELTDEDKAIGTMFGIDDLSPDTPVQEPSVDIEQSTEPPGTPVKLLDVPQVPQLTEPPGTPVKSLDVEQLTDVQKMIVSDLNNQGITNPKEVANVLAQVEAESGFRSRNENLNYTPERLFALYGAGNNAGNKVRFKTISEAKAVTDAGPEAVANIIYGGRMGNREDGEGFRYRGRGLIQFTGKDNYKKYGNMIGEDLISNPELANDPKVASKLTAAYYSDKKSRGTNLADSSSIGRATGYAGGQAETNRRAIVSAKYETKLTPPSAVIASAEPNQQNNNVVLPQDIQAQIANSGTDEQDNLIVALIYQRHQAFTQVRV